MLVLLFTLVWFAVVANLVLSALLVVRMRRGQFPAWATRPLFSRTPAGVGSLRSARGVN